MQTEGVCVKTSARALRSRWMIGVLHWWSRATASQVSQKICSTSGSVKPVCRRWFIRFTTWPPVTNQEGLTMGLEKNNYEVCALMKPLKRLRRKEEQNHHDRSPWGWGPPRHLLLPLQLYWSPGNPQCSCGPRGPSEHTQLVHILENIKNLIPLWLAFKFKQAAITMVIFVFWTDWVYCSALDYCLWGSAKRLEVIMIAILYQLCPPGCGCRG